MAGQLGFLGGLHLGDEAEIALGEAPATVEQQVGDAAGQETVERPSARRAVQEPVEFRPELRRPALEVLAGGVRRRGRGRRLGFGESGGPSEPLRIGDGQTAVSKGLNVVFDGNAVRHQCLLDEARLERQQALLVRGADQEDVAGDAVAEQALGGGPGVHEVAAVAVREEGEALAQFVERRHPGGAVGDHRRRADAGGVADHGRRVLREPLQVVGRDRGQQIEGERQIGLAVAELVGSGDGPAAEQQVRYDRAALLRQAGLVEVDRVPALHQGRGDEDRVDGHYAGAADAHEQRPERGFVRQLTDGFRRLVLGERRRGCSANRLRSVAQFDGHEGRAVAIDAGVVQVAGRLVDLGLAAVLRLERPRRTGSSTSPRSRRSPRRPPG